LSLPSTDPTPTDIYTLSLHDALPIYHVVGAAAARHARDDRRGGLGLELGGREVVEEREGTGAVRQDVVHTVVHEILPHRVVDPRSEEHTSELQSLRHLVCRLLLEKKK